MPTQQSTPSKPPLPTFQDFQTFQDRQLKEMLKQARLFESEFTCPNPGQFKARWLSFVGTSGIGKTFLANILFQSARKCLHLAQHVELINGVARVTWPDVVRRLRDGEHWLTKDLEDRNWLLVDEIGSSHDKTGFTTDALASLAAARVGKWTMFTCNKKLASIASEIDTRIASRMVRDGSVVVEVDTQDFALRKTIP